MVHGLLLGQARHRRQHAEGVAAQQDEVLGVGGPCRGCARWGCSRWGTRRACSPSPRCMRTLLRPGATHKMEACTIVTTNHPPDRPIHLQCPSGWRAAEEAQVSADVGRSSLASGKVSGTAATQPDRIACKMARHADTSMYLELTCCQSRPRVCTHQTPHSPALSRSGWRCRSRARWPS